MTLQDRHRSIFSSMVSMFCFALCAALTPGSTCGAQQFTYTAPTIQASPGGLASGTILLESTVAIESFSFGVCFDTSVLSVISSSQGSDVAATNGGSGAEFFSNNISASGEFTCGCIISLPPGVELLPPGPAQELFDFTLQASPAATGSVPLTICETVDPPVSVIVVINGPAVPVTTIDGAVEFPVVEEFERGDCNSDGQRDLSDAITVLLSLFPNGTPPPLPCLDACDMTDDGNLNIADPIAMLAVFFEGFPAFEPLTCGEDPTEGDPFDCVTSGNCP